MGVVHPADELPRAEVERDGGGAVPSQHGASDQDQDDASFGTFRARAIRFQAETVRDLLVATVPPALWSAVLAEALRLTKTVPAPPESARLHVAPEEDGGAMAESESG